MRRVQVYGGILLVLALVGCGYWGYHTMKYKNGAKAEATLQEGERQQIREQLKQFHDAWQAYRADHKGADPASIEMLIPKYLPHPEILIDPTAQRWRKLKFDMAPGQVKIGELTYPQSYQLRWLVSGNPRLVKKQGDQAILVACDTQMEAMYMAAYGHKAPPGAFNPPLHDTLIDEVRATKLLVVRRNGSVEEIDPNSE